MKKPLTTLRDFGIYILIVLLGWFIRRLSIHFVGKLSGILGNFLYDTIKLRREMVERNLRFAFPEKKEIEILRIARASYEIQVMNLLEILRFPMIQTKADAERYFHIDTSLVKKLCLDKGQGGVVVSAHFGNWELMAYCFSYMVCPTSIVYKPFSNPYLDKKMNVWRTRGGNTLIPMYDATRLGLRALREGELVALLSDQAGNNDGYFTKFMRQDAAIFLGAAVFALRTQLPMILSMPVRIGVGSYRLELLEIPHSDLNYSKANVEILAERYTRAIEDYVYRYPEQWFWLHNRWKRTPKQPLVQD
jgi:Kdo2-lipid IVA lauroyltransferase/acyltransferase